MWKITRVLLCLLVVLGGLEAAARETASSRPASGPATRVEAERTRPADSPRDEHDPFATSERMLLEAVRLREAGPEGAETIPALHLRGMIEDGIQPPVAIVEVDGGGRYIVRPGDSVTLSGRGRGVLLKVRQISSTGVVVEVGTLKQMMVVR